MVTNDGVLKIIDLGFGKRIFSDGDFEKSVTLNWWCPKPKEFDSDVYNFCTEVYFVGKLFQKLLIDSGVETFAFRNALDKMCSHEPGKRFSTFSSVQQYIQGRGLDIPQFTAEHKKIYQSFSAAMRLHVSKVMRGCKYKNDSAQLIRDLRANYAKFALEEKVPDCIGVLSCFLSGQYWYVREGLSVSVVRHFIELLESYDAAGQGIILSNLYNTLDTVERAVPEEHFPDEDIPF